ncbi:histidine kinase [Spirosoma sp. BT702]|uniref:Histidine kinase n=1 Tax=Spirosoma profusum TaxID=2771354 RepID=A0A927AU78_9BACT|nr:histidine kinase [Spirosoma profusum]MBD2702882.1 histidine kinase [Spirosoma profusum]
MRNANRNILPADFQHSLKEELEVERVINFFAMSLLEQSTIADVLWDVARNCIARLNFVDCVIYQLDTTRNVLVQLAAHGRKGPALGIIHCPIEIKLGDGIVGSVALSGQAERIGNTSLDKRYIADDEVRFSEITVPIWLNGKVWGVIDAEHPKRNFFRPHHLTILTKIAALCAQKIGRVETELAYQRVQQQLSENNRRMAETKLLALRLQMNPHFVFNSLNAINKFVLENESEQASLYLTKFSRLMRQIMANTSMEWVSLHNELKALQLYIELELLRCDNQFEFVFTIGKSLLIDTVFIPPMVTYPYIENAIRHGLLQPNVVKPTLRVECYVENDYLYIAIGDNGIGRAASIKSQVNGLTAHKSYGNTLTQERLQLVNQIYDADASITINDRTTTTGQPAGTDVTFTMKLRQP